jgi:hypothetical protein
MMMRPGMAMGKLISRGQKNMTTIYIALMSGFRVLYRTIFLCFRGMAELHQTHPIRPLDWKLVPYLLVARGS